MTVAVSALVRTVVTEHAPEELVLLEASERLDVAERGKPPAPGAGGAVGYGSTVPDPPGYGSTVPDAAQPGSTVPDAVQHGMDVVVPLVAPVLWLVLTELARQTAQTAVESTTGRLRSRIRAFRNRGQEPEPVIVTPLTTEQLSLVRARVLDQCAEAGVSTSQATALANAVFHELATHSSDDEPHRNGGPDTEPTAD